MSLSDDEVLKLESATAEIADTVGRVFVQALPEIMSRHGIDEQLAYFAIGKACVRLAAQLASGSIRGRFSLEVIRAEESPEYVLRQEVIEELLHIFGRLQAIVFDA
jgi:hypothetical protein